MTTKRFVRACVIWFGAWLCLANFPNLVIRSAMAQGGISLLGGPKGLVRTTTGILPEGIMVQLIAADNNIRTTVYTNGEGRYEFPKLERGVYTLRIALPREYKPYVKESLQIEGGTQQLEEITLERVTTSDLLPPTPEIAAQLTGAEWMLNLPGTAEEKMVFHHNCSSICHDYQLIFRNRFDEHGWRLMVDRMINYQGTTLINRMADADTPGAQGRSGLPRETEVDIMAGWLAKVRGPESKDKPFYVLPRPRGKATRVIITEFEVPHVMQILHSGQGDSKGNFWYPSQRTPYVGKLDPRTGKVTEYRLPSTPGALPGIQSMYFDENGILWVSENWSHKLTSIDPKTGEFKSVSIETTTPFNSPGFANFALHPDGSIWLTRGGPAKFDPNTGKMVKQWPFKKMRGTYDSTISKDGRFWSGGQWPGNLVGMLDIQTGELWEAETATPLSGPAKGGFDWEGNSWFGGRGGALIKMDGKTKRASEYYPPTRPYIAFYDAMPDKNGEVWSPELQGGRVARFNPRTDQWVEYVLPEPHAFNRRTYIDSSTNPVTVWYGDDNSYVVRIQPLE